MAVKAGPQGRLSAKGLRPLNCGAGGDSCESPWTAKRSNWSVLEEINPDCFLEGQILKMKLKYFGHLIRRKDSLEKSLMLGTIDGKRRRGWQRMRWLDGVTEAVGVSLSGLRGMVEDRKEYEFSLEMSPYEDVENEESLTAKYDKLATQISGAHMAGDSANPCLQATNICHLDHRCLRLRSRYAKICSAGHPCDQRKCHQGLRLFFERVDLDFTKRLLFCPCQDEVCGERRWNTIVPECSFQSGSKPNCLVLLDACLKDNICK
ncbi:GDNF family receptor alpha-4 [Varanus komodoensis]|nr:GDNF family receptor alpha-4 [Varanus komodoensis]